MTLARGGASRGGPPHGRTACRTIPVPATAAGCAPARRLYSVTAVAGLSMLVTQCAPQQCAPAPAPAPPPAPVAEQVVDLVEPARGPQHGAGAAERCTRRSTTPPRPTPNDQAARDHDDPRPAPTAPTPAQRIAAAGYAWLGVGRERRRRLARRGVGDERPG